MHIASAFVQLLTQHVRQFVEDVIRYEQPDPGLECPVYEAMPGSVAARAVGNPQHRVQYDLHGRRPRERRFKTSSSIWASVSFSLRCFSVTRPSSRSQSLSSTRSSVLRSLRKSSGSSRSTALMISATVDIAPPFPPAGRRTRSVQPDVGASAGSPLQAWSVSVLVAALAIVDHFSWHSWICGLELLYPGHGLPESGSTARWSKRYRRGRDTVPTGPLAQTCAGEGKRGTLALRAKGGFERFRERV